MTVMGAKVDNDGYIAINLLDSEEKILCETNLDLCCNKESTGIMTGPVGNWYFPDGSIVLPRKEIGDATPFFVRTRGPSVVRLFIVNQNMNLPPQRGRFCCVVPNSSNTNQTYFINICKLFQYPNMI